MRRLRALAKTRSRATNVFPFAGSACDSRHVHANGPQFSEPRRQPTMGPSGRPADHRPGLPGRFRGAQTPRGRPGRRCPRGVCDMAFDFVITWPVWLLTTEDSIERDELGTPIGLKERPGFDILKEGDKARLIAFTDKDLADPYLSRHKAKWVKVSFDDP